MMVLGDVIESLLPVLPSAALACRRVSRLCRVEMMPKARAGQLTQNVRVHFNCPKYSINSHK